jgi:type II secretory pathway component PulF
MKKINKRKLRKEMIAHFKMFSRLYSAGVPLIESLDVFCDENSFDWKNQVIENLKMGKTFGQSIEGLNSPIRDYELTIIKKSESSGNLSDGINRVCEMSKNIEKTKSKFLLALLYPCIILIVSGVLILMILTIIVPKIKPLFSGGRIIIPWTTQVLFFLGTYLPYILLVIFVFISIGVLLVMWFIKKRGLDVFKNYIGSLAVKVPVLGVLINHYSAAISFRIASEVFASSGLLVESLRDSAMGSIIPREKIKLLNVANQVEGGMLLSKSIGREISRENRLWLPLIVCGEQTGSISETFSSIAQIHQEYFDESIAVINKLIEPISMIAVGLGVGFIAVSIITPMYSLISYTGY